MTRPSWNSYFLDIAHLGAKRATCIRRQCGAVIVKDNEVISTGYNGAPKGLPHCDENSCLRKKLNIPSGERHEICRATHAEMNAIAQAAKRGASIENADIYITTSPCAMCSKLIINSGIKRIFLDNYDYPDQLGLSMLIDASVKIYLVAKDVMYDFRPCRRCGTIYPYQYDGNINMSFCKNCHDKVKENWHE